MKPVVSDHALVRFLERSGSGDVERLRRTISASLENSCRAAHSIGLTEFTIVADGLIYQIRNGTLTTVLEQYHPPRRDDRQRGDRQRGDRDD